MFLEYAIMNSNEKLGGLILIEANIMFYLHVSRINDSGLLFPTENTK